MLETIKDMRRALGMTQAEFAAALGIPRRSVQNWEKGITIPPKYVVDLIRYRVEHDPTLTAAEKKMKGESPMEEIKVLHDQLGCIFLSTARRMTGEEKKRYAKWCRDLMMYLTGEPVYLRSLGWREVNALAHTADKDVIGLCPGGSGKLYALTDDEWAALIAADQQTADAKAVAERAERIDYLRDLLARADAQRVDGKLPFAAEAKEKARRYNNVYNEGGEGYVPHYYTQEEYDRMSAELATLTAAAEGNT